MPECLDKVTLLKRIDLCKDFRVWVLLPPIIAGMSEDQCVTFCTWFWS